MSLFEELKAMGVNIDEGLKRLNGNETLYKRLLALLLRLFRHIPSVRILIRQIIMK